ncbi:MAG: hypothetical protein WD825_10045 [Gemmatimonadaceae bacterium]
MVNFLEALYGVTALSFGASLVLLIKGRRLAARRAAIVGATCAVLAIVLYWYLSASA